MMAAQQAPQREGSSIKRRWVLAIGAGLIVLLIPGLAQAPAVVVSSQPEPGQRLGIAPVG